MKNLLIVDDEKLVLSSLSEVIKMSDADLNITTAENGEEAEKVLNSTNIDILITDLNMPVKSGYELLAYMFKDHSDIPVIVMTASSCGSSCSMLRALGVKNIISKPIKYEKMMEMINDVLHERQSARTGGKTHDKSMFK